MKYGLLGYDFDDKKILNVGDYIQSLAAKQFLPEGSNVVIVNREKLNATDEYCKLIMNGWFMHHPENWPPSKMIEPLLISMHINPLKASQMLSDAGIEFFERYGPVGCRDKNTQEILNKKGIKNYFTGCLTLTLGKSYKHTGENNEIIFVEPYMEKISKKNIKETFSTVKAFLFSMCNYRKAKSVANKIKLIEKRKPKGVLRKIKRKVERLAFYSTYSKIFDEKILLNASYVTHDIPKSEIKTEKERFEYADLLLTRFSKAKLIVTTRLHAALPARAMGTPVFFITHQKFEENDNRFDGLIDYVKTFVLRNGEFVSSKNNDVTFVDESTKLDNPGDIRPLVERMSKKIYDFLGK